MNKGARRIAVGAVVASLAGYIAGVLTAPKSGKETRGFIKTTADNGVTETERRLKELHTELGSLLSKLSENEKDIESKTIKNAQKAKQKTREILSAIHEGDANDKDLQKAVNEAKKAIESVKKYIKK